MSEPKKQKLESFHESQAKAYQSYIKTSAVGLEFGLAIAVGALAGYFIDKYFHCSPWALIIGLLFGLAAGIKRLWSFAKSYVEKDDSDDHQN